MELLKKAVIQLKQELSDIVVSSVYCTKPMYVEDQDDFYNMAALGYVDNKTDPFEFLKKINLIEAKYGRDRDKEIRFGPRSLDIDIELFGDDTISDPILQIPHVRMEERAFVLVPAIEILKDSADELIRKKYSACLLKLEKEGKADDIEKLL